METLHEDDVLGELNTQREIALRRAKRLIEFMSLVCANERRILHAPGGNTDIPDRMTPVAAQSED